MPDAWYRRATPHRHLDLVTPVVDEGAGPPLLCLHGFPTSSWDFEPLWPALTSRFRCLAFDLIGLGRASKPARALTIGLQADVAEGLLVTRGVREASLLAHDLGDTVAQELLARQVEGRSPVRWLAVVLLNGGLFPESHRPRPVQHLLASPLGPVVARLSTERTFRRNLVRIFGPDTPPSERFLRGSWRLLLENDGRAALPRLIRYLEERRANRERWVRPLVDRVVPVRLIDGSLDPVSGRHLADRYLQLVPNADVVHLPRLGHYPHVEDPDAVLAPALDFLGRHPARGG